MINWSVLLLYIWQLPQNLLGLLVILFTGAEHDCDDYWLTYKGVFGVCLGNYIIFGDNKNSVLVSVISQLKHEQGHQKQSRYLGPLYLLIIGLPSALGNIWDRLFHRKWPSSNRIAWYYSLPWEKWADKLGGVNRGIIDRRYMNDKGNTYI